MCAIGVFDGVHLGHRALLDALVDDAVNRGGVAIVVTFDCDPDELFCPAKVHKLLSNEERIKALETAVGDVLVLSFTKELASWDYGEFLDYLRKRLPDLSAIHVGDNFRCGARALGGISEITAWGNKHDITVNAHSLLIDEGAPVSASRIRSLLAKGDVEGAAALLGYRFALTGRVTQGAGRGAGLGFATANIEIDGSLAIMGPFVYAAYAVLDDVRYKAAVSIGEPPTFSPESCVFNPFYFEAHILDFERDLYGQELRLEFVKSLRPMQRFESREELVATVMGNINWVRENL